MPFQLIKYCACASTSSGPRDIWDWSRWSFEHPYIYVRFSRFACDECNTEWRRYFPLRQV